MCTMVLGPFVNSCDNLDENLYNQVAVSEFGKTQAETGCPGRIIYSGMQRYDPLTIIAMEDISGGFGVIPRRGGDWWDGGAHMELTMHTWTPQSGYEGSIFLMDTKTGGFWYSAYHNITIAIS